MASTILFRKGLRSGCYPLRPFATRSSRMHTTLTPSPPKAIPLVYHPLYSGTVPFDLLPAGHRFPMQVFRGIYERLQELQSEGRVRHQVHAPDLSLPYLRQRLLLCHEQEYVDRFVSGGLTAKELRRIGFPWSEGLVWRTLSELSGTMLAAELALEHGIALSCAGGTHHAHRDFGSGFCIFNDLAVTAVGLLREGAARRILVVDADVHQGDGTAAILAGESGAFTLSIHCGDNFPARKQRSDLDVSLPRGTGDEEYLSALAESLSSTIGNFGPPDLVLYDAGVDVHEDDSLGHLCVTDEGIYRRDKVGLPAHTFPCFILKPSPPLGLTSDSFASPGPSRLSLSLTRAWRGAFRLPGTWAAGTPRI